MRPPLLPPIQRHSPPGFTLVEVLVSAAVLLVGVLGLVAVLVKAGELEVSDRHRRRARELIDSCMEQWSVMPVCDYDSIETGKWMVVIDERDIDSTGDELVDTLSVDTTSDTQLGAGSVNVTYRKIKVKVMWNESDRMDSLVMHKWVTDLR